jgi:hypothetical protein
MDIDFGEENFIPDISEPASHWMDFVTIGTSTSMYVAVTTVHL